MIVAQFFVPIWSENVYPYKQLFAELKGKTESLVHQAFIRKRWKSILIDEDVTHTIKARLKQQLSENPAPLTLLADEKKLVHHIRHQTKRRNQNNVTRTEAYRQIYFKHPELHWAFLAHMVSRNGGWSMTDLKGELLAHLLNSANKEHFFIFLERCNSLIFHDAYPQLLLYESSKQMNKNLFHLLPAFHVSRFMIPIWHYFWQQQDSKLLTISLIINEQHYIENRVVQDSFYQDHILKTLPFHLQELLHLTQVIFPYYVHKHPLTQDEIRLAGLVIKDFRQLEERIHVGKKLYAILFGYDQVYQGSLQFAQKKPHTGSRVDFWSHLFSAKSHQATKKIYSPILKVAWPDQSFEPPEHSDWFQDEACLQHYQAYHLPKPFDMTQDLKHTLQKINFAAEAKDYIGNKFD